ncbi:MAG: hypothetical protein QM703_24915 [Gemmatales bacterium]
MPTLTTKPKKPSIYREMLKDLQDLKAKIDQGESIVVHQVSKEGGRMVIRRKRVSASEFFKGKSSADSITPMSKEEVKHLRDDLALSQAAFARWLSASPGTVRQWEQTTGVKAGPALRLLHLLKSDTKGWRKRIHAELVGA